MSRREIVYRAVGITGALAIALIATMDVVRADAGAVEWAKVRNATATASAIRKAGGCDGCLDSGGMSRQTILTGDGYVEFVPVAGARLYAGLSSNLTAVGDPIVIDFAFSFWPEGGWDIRERNAYKKEGRFVAGDVFRIALVSGVIKYYKNGSLVYSSTAPVALPLVFDVSLIGGSAALTSASIGGQSLGTDTNPVVISTNALPEGTVNQAYAATLLANGGGGSYRWSVAAGALPPGLTLNSTGTIGGTPNSAGIYAFTVRAADASVATNYDDQALSIVVRAPTQTTSSTPKVLTTPDTVLTATPPMAYDAITDRTTRAKGPLPVLGPAGYAFTDPVFGSRLLRVTDRSTRPAALDRSYRTPSSVHLNAWSIDGRYFYVTSTDGTPVPYSFDAATMRATRLPSSTDDGGLTLRFFSEPTFSYVKPGVLYGAYNGTGSNLRSIDEFDLGTGIYRQILNLDTLVSGLSGTYTGGLGASAGAVERIFAFFGGGSQDQHFYLVVFDKSNPANRMLVNTLASTVDGVATNVTLNFRIHAAAIDRSGRYVIIYPTAVDQQAPRSAPPAYIWDTTTNTFTGTPLLATRFGGHDAYGYGHRINQDCCTSSTWDAGQWQFRSLATPSLTADLIAPVLQPKEVYLAEHPSWHNAQPLTMVPFLDATYRYGTIASEWRAWDEEIIAVQTEAAGTGATVWRFAHHRSAVANDSDPTRISFWYTPRVNIAPDGRWALFTSNWEKKLGTDARGEAGGTYRQDVFLIELKGIDAQSGTVAIRTSALPAAPVGVPYAATLQASGGSGTYTWSVVSGALPAGLTLNAATGVISGTPSAVETVAFTIRVADSAAPANTADQVLSISVAAWVMSLQVTTTTLPEGKRLSPYSATLTAMGGSGSLAWSIASGGLPPGLVLDPSGVISGTPTQNGVWTVTVRVVDSASPPNSATWTLTLKVRRK